MPDDLGVPPDPAGPGRAAAGRLPVPGIGGHLSVARLADVPRWGSEAVATPVRRTTRDAGSGSGGARRRRAARAPTGPVAMAERRPGATVRRRGLPVRDHAAPRRAMAFVPDRLSPETALAPDRRSRASRGPAAHGNSLPAAARRAPPGPDRRPPPRPAVADAEQLAPGEELVAGRRPVEEAFAARRSVIRLLVTPGRRQALERIVLHATTLRIPIVEVEGGSLTALAGFDGHQGVALVVEPRRFATLQEVLARAIERGEPPFVLVLDSLEDPQNLGTVLRSAEGAGVHGVLFPTERQAPLSPAAVKASAGATEHLLLCPVDDLAGALTDLHVRGIRVVGSEADAPLTARQADLRGPLAIVVGSEGHGLSPTVRRRCDLMVRIPMRGSMGRSTRPWQAQCCSSRRSGNEIPRPDRSHVRPPISPVPSRPSRAGA